MQTNTLSLDAIKKTEKMSFRSWLLCRKFNLFPAYRGSGGRVTFISDDLRRLRLKIPLNWRTRNYVGTLYGGSMYGAVDPIYMFLFIQLLGKGYIVWDKAAVIRYKKPARSTLYAEFEITEEELECIRRELAQQDKIDRIYHIDLKDAEGTLCATVDKTLHFRRKR